MTAKKMILSVCLLMTGMGLGELQAQTALKALVQKCEMMDSVTVSVVQRKNETTRELEQNLVTVSFRNNPALAQEIKKAFEADKKDAIQMIEEKEKGELRNVFYTFKEGNRKISYSYDMSRSGSGTLSVIDKTASAKPASPRVRE